MHRLRCCNIPVLRWGEPYTSMEVDEVVHFATGEPIAEVSRANGGLIQRDMRTAQRARDVLREIPIDDLIERIEKAGELYMNAHAADRRRHADARRVRPRAVGDHRPARAHVQRNMKKNAFVLADMEQDPRLADARARSRHPVARLRRRARRADQLSGAVPGARPGAAVELARRAHAVAADHPAAGRPGAQAGPAGAVDAVPHGRGVLRRPASRARRSRSIPAAPTSAPRCSTAAPRA